MANQRPIILITGAAGGIGSALCRALKPAYTVVGVDRVPSKQADSSYTFDLTDSGSVRQTLEGLAAEHGRDIAAVIHLAAYFDFTGEHSPLYEAVNVNGTRYLLEALRDFTVERFIYSSTMLVHAPRSPGDEPVTEDSPLAPGWAYPESKLATEQVIQAAAGSIPYTLLRLAGLYDEQTGVPTLSNQIARIYERDFKSHLYAGDPDAGQAFLHREDMIDAFIRTVERRTELPARHALLIGEDQSLSYRELQDRLGELIHGKREWQTLALPQSVAKAGAWLEEKAEPLIPDDFDHGEKPFIRPFMIDLASDHYVLDVGRARELLGWRPRHHIYDGLAPLVDSLKRDPLAWYRRNGITPPDWISAAEEAGHNAGTLLQRYRRQFAAQHQQSLWAHFVNMMLAAWLITAPFTLGYSSMPMTVSDIGAGIALLVCASLSLSASQTWARWACAVVGMWLLFAPLAFWAPDAAAYLNDTLVGMLVIGLAVLIRPSPGVSPVAAMTGPNMPPGWSMNPSDWFQRVPIIALALLGLLISRYLTAYQLGHIDSVWDPFFAGAPDDPRNGTAEIITSSVSRAWPVPDAGLGAMVYALEILVGLVGSTRRWRTMPWLVMLFGFLIVPLGAVSITFIIIQPIVLGTWCALCLIGAAAMLVQIPYSLDELVATGQFLLRRYRAGRPVLKIFLVGDTDEPGDEHEEKDFQRPPGPILKDMFGGGVNLPWNLALCILIGVWLMLTRITLGNSGGMADWDHLIGALVITVAVSALAEVARPVRLLIVPLAAVLLVTPFMYPTDGVALIASLFCGLALMALSIPRGRIEERYGNWNRWLY